MHSELDELQKDAKHLESGSMLLIRVKSRDIMEALLRSRRLRKGKTG